jgi:hypothetical protein
MRLRLGWAIGVADAWRGGAIAAVALRVHGCSEAGVEWAYCLSQRRRG